MKIKKVLVLEAVLSFLIKKACSPLEDLFIQVDSRLLVLDLPFSLVGFHLHAFFIGKSSIRKYI